MVYLCADCQSRSGREPFWSQSITTHCDLCGNERQCQCVSSTSSGKLEVGCALLFFGFILCAATVVCLALMRSHL